MAGGSLCGCSGDGIRQGQAAVIALAMVREAGSRSSRRPALRYVQQRASGKIACAAGRQSMVCSHDRMLLIHTLFILL